MDWYGLDGGNGFDTVDALIDRCRGDRQRNTFR